MSICAKIWMDFVDTYLYEQPKMFHGGHQMTRYFIPPTDKHGRSWGRALLLVLVSLTLLATQMAGAAQTVDPDSDPAIDELTAQAIDRLAEVSGEPLFQTTRIYDRHGALLYELSDRGRRDVVPLEVIPEVLIQATLATEDKNFYQHTGVDWAAVARAAWQNWQADEIVSGASTITQQLAGNMFIDVVNRQDISVRRKLREMKLRVGYVDSVIIADRPRLSGYIEPMKERIAGCIGLDKDSVSVKATTQEGLGFVGRGEGIGAMAVVLLEKER